MERVIEYPAKLWFMLGRLPDRPPFCNARFRHRGPSARRAGPRPPPSPAHRPGRISALCKGVAGKKEKLRFPRLGLRYRGGYGRCPGIFPWRADGDSDGSDGTAPFLARHSCPSPSRRGCGGQSDESECPSGSKQVPDGLSRIPPRSGGPSDKSEFDCRTLVRLSLCHVRYVCTKRRCAPSSASAENALVGGGAGW